MKTEPKANAKVEHEIRIVPEALMDQAEDIWSVSFHPGWQRDFYRSDLETVYGAFSGNNLHAVAATMDFDIYVADQWVKCAGIACVATAPGQRNQGLIEKLMKQALGDLHRKQVPITCLGAFSYPYYERMGYACTHWLEQIEVSTRHLRKVATAGDATKWRRLSADHYEATLPLHRQMCEQHNLALNRTAARGRTVALDPGRERHIYAHPSGYMIWGLDKTRDRKLYLVEFVHLDEQCYMDGLAFLGQMDAQFDAVIWCDRNHEELFKLGIPDPRPNVQRLPWTLSRVLHMGAFEKLLPDNKSLKGLNVCDPLGISAGAQGDINVGQLVQHLAGTWSTPDRRFPSDLYNVLSKKPVYTFEFF